MQPDNLEFCPKDGARLVPQTPKPELEQKPQPVSGPRPIPKAIPRPLSQAAKPAPNLPDADPRHKFPATLMGVGGSDAAKLAAAVQQQEHNQALQHNEAQQHNSDATQAFDLSTLQNAGIAPPPRISTGIPKPITAQHKPVPAPIRPASTASPAAPAPKLQTAQPQTAQPQTAQPHKPQTTLAKTLEQGPLPVNVAVGRVTDIADLLALMRPPHPVTPAHVGYDDAKALGKPRWVDLGPQDPAYLAQYQPPDLEQGVTPATDVYTLGCLLFETLTGKAPFRGKTVEEIVRKHAIAAAPAVRQVRKETDLPPALEIELQRSLKKRPGDRHPSIAAFVEGLRHAIREDDRSTTALDVSEARLLQQLLNTDTQPPKKTAHTPAPLPAVRTLVPAMAQPQVPAMAQPQASEAPQSQPQTAPQPPKRTGLILALVVGGLAVIGGGAFVALHPTQQPTPVALPPTPTPVASVPAVPEPDILGQPDVNLEPDTGPTPDIRPEPDVQPDIQPEPSVPPEPDRPKNKLPVRKPDGKPPEKVPEKPPEKLPEKKQQENRPPVF